ncbi:DUF1194 domain-containing protein [uncultured Roseibium sp.]|uniref:DUF1194 domain-containing protein n=1 Tax=uncultured Roseibium sp. TaxID=1936171 RepID=UPI002618E9AE|nr:DUF1194 domain-containing protein [uncultured Roseibium sp.]
MLRHHLRLRIALVLLAMLAPLSLAKAQERVDVALVLAVDVSRSMSPDELRIQRRGYAAAISSAEVVRAIELGAHGKIALMMFEWANDNHVRVIVDWTLIDEQADAVEFADKVLRDESYSQRRTSISGAIKHAAEMLEEVPFEADRYVIDISGDGPNNHGTPVTLARDAAVESGITINGLPLMTTGGPGSQFNIPDLDVYYRRCVTGGPASFVIPVTDWAQFPDAVRRKLILEIGGFAPLEPLVQPVQFTFEEPYDCLVGEKIWRRLREQFFWDP